MDAIAKHNLFDKTKVRNISLFDNIIWLCLCCVTGLTTSYCSCLCYLGGWNLPTGSHVDRALKIKCSQLYRHWQYRLKELHFVGKSVQEAINIRPSNVDQVAWRWLVIDY